MLYDAARHDPAQHAIWRQSPFWERFNIDGAQIAQLQGAHPEAAAIEHGSAGSAEVAYGNYVRF
eukprot:8659050-Karenia_brevis.AAC.1